jgi:predicted SnoaL-like aldol condensation-catalyzing enzyme
MEAMKQNAAKNPNKALEIQSAIQERNRVAVFSRVRQNPEDRGGAVVHIFRFEKDRIVEFWDIGQAVPEQSVNENDMF